MPALLCALCGVAGAAPVSHDIDPNHSYPGFEADHMGISVWRGKFNKSCGKVVLDKAAGSGTLDVQIDPACVNFGRDKLDAWAVGPEFFDAAKFPRARYRGCLTSFVDGAPTQAVGLRIQVEAIESE